MSRSEAAPEWRHDYPWGRKLPKKRIAELTAKRARILRERDLLRERFEERMIDFERQLQAVEADIELAQQCELDRLRRRIKALVLALLDYGIDVQDRIAAGLPSEATVEELSGLLETAKRSGQQSGVLSVPEIPSDDETLGDGPIADDDLILESELEELMPTSP